MADNQHRNSAEMRNRIAVERWPGGYFVLLVLSGPYSTREDAVKAIDQLWNHDDD